MRLILALALVLALAAPAHAAKRQFSVFEAPRELTGTDDGLRNEVLDEVQALGVTHIRVLLYWSLVEGKDGYDWSRYDALFAGAQARGIQVIPTLVGGEGHVFKPDRSAFARFVKAVGKRYGEQVGIWTVWNEPNQPQFLKPQYVDGKPFSPMLYRALYQGALQGLSESGNVDDLVLAGETSPRGTSNVVAPITFARQFFKGHELKVDGWAHHPYTTKEGPFFVPGGGDVTIGVIGRLLKTLDKASPNGKLDLYLTEFGIQSKPDPFYGVSQQRQAEYRSISEKIAYDNPRVQAFSQYLMRDDEPRSGSDKYGGFESGLKLADGTPKLAYDGYRLPLVATQRGDKTKLWGLARPAGGRTTVTLEQRDGGAWTAVGQVRTDGRGYFKRTVPYEKGREYRVLWETFSGPPTATYIAP